MSERKESAVPSGRRGRLPIVRIEIVVLLLFLLGLAGLFYLLLRVLCCGS